MQNTASEWSKKVHDGNLWDGDFKLSFMFVYVDHQENVFFYSQKCNQYVLSMGEYIAQKSSIMNVEQWKYSQPKKVVHTIVALAGFSQYGVLPDV